MSDIFSKRFIEQRQKKGMTQAQLAEALEKKRSTISGYETGGKEPDFGSLCEYAEFFGVSTDYLLGLSDNAGNRDDMLFCSNEKVKGSYMTLPALQRGIYVQIYDEFYSILLEEIRSGCSDQLTTYLELFAAFAEFRKIVKNKAENFINSSNDLSSLNDLLATQNEFKTTVENFLNRLLTEDLKSVSDYSRR